MKIIVPYFGKMHSIALTRKIILFRMYLKIKQKEYKIPLATIVL